MHLVKTYQRYTFFAAVVVLCLLSLALLALTGWAWIGVAVFGALSALGLYDVTQRHHAILRNYPVLGHMRFIFEGIRPEIRQYLIESDQDEEPFSRDMRAIIY